MAKTAYHFVGIGGIGMSGLARILLQREAQVSGSDLAETQVTVSLSKGGARLYLGHSENHIQPHQTVVYSSDIKGDNPELLAAKKLKCAVLHRSQLLATLMEGHKGLAVGGTHGKTTTTALLTWVLLQAGYDPSYAIGGLLTGLQSNAAQGKGEIFVAEADESDGSFLNYAPHSAIVTNIDLDHIGHYGSEQALIEAFRQFCKKVSTHLFWCAEDMRLRNLALPGTSYGFTEGTLRASAFKQRDWHCSFDVSFHGKTYKDLELALPGRHNALNGLAVFGLALQLGVKEDAIRQAFRSFPGVQRRCEKRMAPRNVLVLDDYAHHPTEIRATLHSVRAAVGPRRVIAVFQPHRYSRTEECIGLYRGIFEDADEVIITDLYAAREVVKKGISHETVMKEVPNAVYCGREQLTNHLSALVRPHDVVVCLGAGDITKVAQELAQTLERHPAKKYAVAFLCGGVSTEHAVTLLSAGQVLPKLNADFYDITQIGITKEGVWIHSSDIVKELEQSSRARVKKGVAGQPISPDVLKELYACEVVVPMLHGTYGEDGIVQGFLEILKKPYVGCDHRASAISMDKAVAKKLCQIHGIDIAPFVDFNRHQWLEKQEELINEIESQFTYPIWVKPTHLGSSVGVNRVEDRNSLIKAVAIVFEMDTHAMVEPEVRGRELEVAVLGDGELLAFPPGEVFTGQRQYDYDGKYSAGGTPTAAVAEVRVEKAREAEELAKRIFEICGCSGLARVDFFYDERERYIFNEINPIPGFTRNSLYPRMCEANGLQVSPLFDRLIQIALRRRRLTDKLEV